MNGRELPEVVHTLWLKAAELQRLTDQLERADPDRAAAIRPWVQIVAYGTRQLYRERTPKRCRAEGPSGESGHPSTTDDSTHHPATGSPQIPERGAAYGA